MPINEHSNGFDKEEAFSHLFVEIRKYSPELKFSALRNALESIAPAFVASLYERKSCLRNLKYVGCTWDADTDPSDDGFFRLGQIYVATSFNGSTYTIDGYEEVIGCAYFEWIADEMPRSNGIS